MQLSLMFVALIVFLAIGVPIAFAIGASGIIYMVLTNPTFLLTFPNGSGPAPRVSSSSPCRSSCSPVS